MKILHGNNIDHLKTLEDNSVDSLVTDPPYLINFMGKEWDKENSPAGNADFWKEVMRVLKPGAHGLVFGHSRQHHRVMVALEDAGFEIRDCLMWMYGSGFPKSHNIGKATGNSKWEGWGTALKPAYEPIILVRKPLEKKLNNTTNVLKWGTGGLNIDASRIGTEIVSAHHAPKGTFAGGEQDRGSDTNYYENEGRWPANVILDEEAGKILDSQSGGASRFFYCAKVSKKERNAGCEHLEEKKVCQGYAGNVESEAIKNRNVKGDIGLNKVKLRKNDHPTVKPISLMTYLVKLITPPSGIVLDPFMGSGSTGIACVKEGFDFIGMEMEEGYVEIAKSRIEYHKPKPKEEPLQTIDK